MMNDDQNEIQKLKNDVAQMKLQLNALQQEKAEPRAVSFYAFNPDKIQIKKDENIRLPFTMMNPNENTICAFEPSPEGSKITFLKSGDYQMNVSISILGKQNQASPTPIQIYTSVNGRDWSMQFCSIPQTINNWLSYQTGSAICRYNKGDSIYVHFRAYEPVEIWGSTNCYSTFSVVLLNKYD